MTTIPNLKTIAMLCAGLALGAGIEAVQKSYIASIPQLKTLFECTAAVPQPASTERNATLVNVKDRATGQEHLELRRGQYGAKNVDLPATQYPTGDAGAKTGIAGAVEFCTHGAAPLTLAPARPA